MSATPRDRISRTGLLALVIFILGATWTAYVYHQRVRQQERQLASELDAAAAEYRRTLQRGLTPYSATMQGVAAFMSAAQATGHDEFVRYIRRARMMERLGGIREIGYLPTVPAESAAQFEARARQRFPGYRIRQPRAGADVYFPMLYSLRNGEANNIHDLRGVDYSSVPELENAMRTAARTDRPAASRAHGSLLHQREAVVLTFAPVRRADGPAGSDIRDVDGFVYSVMSLKDIFEGLRNSRVRDVFGVELYEGSASAETLLFDSDQVRQALAGDPPPRMQKAEVEFANRTWLMYMFPTADYIDANRAGRELWMFALIGLLLSVLAAVAVAAISRQILSRRASAELMKRFDALFADHPFAVYTFDPLGRIMNVNKKAAQEMRMLPEAMIGQPVERFVPQEQHASMRQQVARALSGRAVVYVETLVDSTGNRADFSLLLIPIRSGAKVVRVLGIGENITERRRAEQELVASRQMLQFILDNVPQRIFWKDTNSVFLGANRNLLRDAGLESVDQIAGKTDFDFAWRGDAPRFQQDDRDIMESGEPRFNVEEPIHHEDGTHWLQTSKVPLKDDSGKVIGILGVAQDITERKRMEEELVKRANHDNMTGLPNRGYFYGELERAVKRARRKKGQLALMYFDIDNFKRINDTHGHGVGDEVILQFAARVRGVVRDADMLARLGGDEFVLIVEDLASRADALALADKLVASLRTPLELRGRNMEVSTSLGIAFYEAGMSTDQLVSAADAAMYEAKQAGRNCYRVTREP